MTHLRGWCPTCGGPLWRDSIRYPCRVCQLVNTKSRFVMDTARTRDECAEVDRLTRTWRGREAEANAREGPAPAHVGVLEVPNQWLQSDRGGLWGVGYTSAEVAATFARICPPESRGAPQRSTSLRGGLRGITWDYWREVDRAHSAYAVNQPHGLFED